MQVEWYRDAGGMVQGCRQNGTWPQTYLSPSDFRFQEHFVLLLTRDRGMKWYHSQPEPKQNGNFLATE